MLVNNNSIIVVDNNSEDLESIARVFNLHGIGCRTIECDGFELLPEPLTGVKIAFFDVNFTDAGDETAILSALRSVLVATISKDNGPYLLVFWTTNTQLVEAFKGFINRDDTYKEVPNPISICVLDKAQFTAQPELLNDRVDQICSSPLAKCLISFDEELKLASDACLRSITSLISVEESWGESAKYEKRFKDVFSMISVETSGKKNGCKYPDESIKESLAPLFVYHICCNGSTVWKDYLDLENVSKSAWKKKDISDIAPSLNTYYHIDPNVADPFARGVVRAIDGDEDYFKSRIGYTKKEWVLKRFLKTDMTFTRGYEIVAVEFSAACDYANDKNRLYKFMLGVLLSDEDTDTLFASAQKPANIYSPEFTFVYKKNRTRIILDLNSTINEENDELFNLLGSSLFKFKHEIMNVITTAHANHESRLGFSCFRGKI